MTRLEVELLLGPSGAGKSTTARLLAAKKIGHIIFVGDKCRELAEQGRLSRGDALALRTGIPLSIGAIHLALDELIPDICQCKRVFIDGPPRSRAQAQLLANRFLIRRIYRFIVPDQVLLQRLISRYRSEQRGDDLPAYAKAKIRAFRNEEPHILKQFELVPITELHYEASHETTVQIISDSYLSGQ